MIVEYVPLLGKQLELQRMPRDMARFERYLGTMISQRSRQQTVVEYPPLNLANPLAREHVTELLEQLTALQADNIGAAAAAESAAALAEIPGVFKLGLVLADDFRGGWTNRFDCEFGLRFGSGERRVELDPQSASGLRLPRWLKDFWLSSVLWSSEPVSAETIRQAVQQSIYRLAYQRKHGPAQTLRQRLAQEGWVLARSNSTTPALAADDLSYTREVLQPYLDATDKRTAIECLFGDAAAYSLGFTPRGLSPWAGIALARQDALTCINTGYI
jgi:hypothetical protein